MSQEKHKIHIYASFLPWAQEGSKRETDRETSFRLQPHPLEESEQMSRKDYILKIATWDDFLISFCNQGKNLQGTFLARSPETKTSILRRLV